MIFKGLKFRRAKNIVALRNTDENGKRMPYVRQNNENCVHFGRCVKNGETPKRSDVVYDTNYKWMETGKVVQATVIADEGWSLTHMMYGADGRIYLMLDGKFYTHKRAVKAK